MKGNVFWPPRSDGSVDVRVTIEEDARHRHSDDFDDRDSHDNTPREEELKT